MDYICNNKTINNMECTRFKSLRSTTPVETVSLLSVLEEIRSEKYKSKVEAIRAEENPSKSPLKDRLPVFTPTGRFNHRSIKGLENYNGVICLDVDGVENPTELKSKCKELPWVFGAFITPSGKGLKVIVKTNANVDNYKDAEVAVAEAFHKATGSMRDNHCKDIARIQFVSYDPETYINENSLTF